VANVSEILHINLYQDRSSIVEVMTKNFWCVVIIDRDVNVNAFSFFFVYAAGSFASKSKSKVRLYYSAL